jgi:multidrug efflux pump
VRHSKIVSRWRATQSITSSAAAAAAVSVIGRNRRTAQTLKRIERNLPVGVEIGKISDQAQVVSKSVLEFLEALAAAIVIVLAAPCRGCRQATESEH